MVKSTLGGSFTQNLSKLPRVDKSDQVASFVKQQERNARVYKAEGLRYVEVWGKENAYSSLSGAPGNPPRVEDGGGMEVMTPVLKARNPGCGLDIAQRQIAQEGRQDTMAKPDPPDPGAKVNAESSRLEKKGAKGVAERTKASPAKRSSKQTKAKNTGSPKKGRDAEKGSENTEERDRQTRMDQRKQRRKEKRDIVNPKKRKPASTDDDSDGSTQKKRAGKSKRQKVPAGLALMHGFSATNVGKSRLTMEPTRSMGVFSRGKVSSKANTGKKTKTTGKQGICDLESFFGKPKAKTFRKARSTAATSESEEEDERPKVAAAKKTSVKAGKASKTKASQNVSIPIESSSSGRTSSESDEERNTVGARTPSITWSIERDSALLPSTDISIPTPAEALEAKRGVPKEPSVAEVLKPVSREGRSSLGPHDSASQCAAISRPDLPKFEMVSKYFESRPTEGRQASECAQEKSVVVTCPRFPSKAGQNPLHVKHLAHPEISYFAEPKPERGLSGSPTGSPTISESRSIRGEVVGSEASEGRVGMPQEDPIWPQVSVQYPENRLDGTASFPTRRAPPGGGSGMIVRIDGSPSPDITHGRVGVGYPSSLIGDYYHPFEDMTEQDAAFQGFENFEEHLDGEYIIQPISQHDELANVYRPATDFTQWECLEERWLEDEQEGITDALYPGQDYQHLTAREEEHWQVDDDGTSPERQDIPFHGGREDIGYEAMVGTDEMVEAEQDAFDSGEALQEEEAWADIYSKSDAQDSSQLGEESQQGSLVGVCQFLAGRSALLGFDTETETMSARLADRDSEKYGGVSKVELDVGRNLKDHWRPQRLY